MIKIDLIIKSCIDTLCFTGVIILIGFILGYLRNKTLHNLQRSFGWRAIAVTAFIGVPIHELSHALFAIIFKHKVIEIKLIQKPDEDGTLGYVNHTYNPLSVYQQIGNFFIGVAPIFGGVGAIIFLMCKLLPNVYNQFLALSTSNLNMIFTDKATVSGIATSYMNLLKTIFSISNFSNINYALFLFLAVCIASHMSLSSADIKGAFGGLAVMYLLLLVINAFGGSKVFMASSMLKYNIILIDFSALSVIFSGIAYILSLMLIVIKKY